MHTTNVSRLVTSKDLNHHGTLFAGQTAMWMVEACFACAAKVNKRTDNILCLNIEGFTFKRPVNNGDVIDIIAYPAYAGRSSLTIVGKIFCEKYGEESLLETAVTFVIIDENGNPTPHGIVVERPEDPIMQAFWDKCDRKRKQRNK
ncbi:MAG: acyl-CoA thioesterase [Candidatus Methanofastidiosa archaeon]|nr:acyl-CoA thioesterase [Candidatus Methanofastidiosa archaeon]